MNYKITGYKPEKLFHFFEDISAIPRGSANEKAIMTISWHLPKNEICGIPGCTFQCDHRVAGKRRG